MALFTRKSRSPTRHTKQSHYHHEPYTMMSRPTFGQWFRHTILDILTMIAMGAIGLGVSRFSFLPGHGQTDNHQ
jgi:hypothetical protein